MEMNKDWLVLVQKYDEASARTKFEIICEGLFRKLNPKKTVRTIGYANKKYSIS